MTAPPTQDPMQTIARMLQPWQDAFKNPPAAQEAVLQALLDIYAQTENRLRPEIWRTKCGFDCRLPGTIPRCYL